MSNRATAILIAAAAVLFILWNSLFIVNEKEQAIVLRFGEITRVVKEPGLYFKAPLSFAGADNVQKLPDRLLRFDLDNIRVQVSGGKFYEVDAFMVYSIQDAALFRQAVSGSIEAAEQRLRTRLDAALRSVYGRRGFEAALSEERGDMMREVRDQIRPDAASLGVELNDVRIRRTDLTQEVSQQTYERMQAERLAEAELLRARGQVSAREIRAAADREAVESIAAARRDAEVLQGEGDAAANRVLAEAYGKDQGFFDFYRSMNAYKAALENSGTTMVLTPDSEFFRYFNSASGVGTGRGPVTGATAPGGAASGPAAAATPGTASGAAATSPGAAETPAPAPAAPLDTSTTPATPAP
ncbi:protease modulator HflC [Mangrovicella endophytica]|uniref:protease modulator HflC n=1 Tax=Mangrovicella endophytica TaxID=2066697 RepID=UPI000C9DD7B6|nr:protease modulator HflC [Mangrovicella endophytica]